MNKEQLKKTLKPLIKECIKGGPLKKPDAPKAQEDFVGRDKEKEFLYDLVNNRHNGLDMDKMDYYLRDELHATGGGPTGLMIFFHDACVAKGICPNPKKCFKCKKEEVPGTHYMICYQNKHVASAMGFFAKRYV